MEIVQGHLQFKFTSRIVKMGFSHWVLVFGFDLDLKYCTRLSTL